MKFILPVLICVAMLASSGCVAVDQSRPALETRVYPISKGALKILLADTYELDAGPHTDSLIGCCAWREKKGPGIFERYGLVQTPDSSLAYDGESLLITNTPANHRVIQDVLGVIEDTLRLQQVEIDMSPTDPFSSQADEK